MADDSLRITSGKSKIKNHGGSIYLDIIIENKMALAVFCEQIKSVVIGKILKLSQKNTQLHFMIRVN